MAVLTAADRIRLGTAGVKRVYAGTTLVWQRASYLVPTVGTATTPDPGVPPDQCVLLYKVRGPLSAGNGNQVIAAQYDNDPQRSYMWRRNKTNGAGVSSVTPTGLAAAAVVTSTPDAPGFVANPTVDEWNAFAIELRSATSTHFLTLWTSPDGVTWTNRGVSASVAALTPFDSTDVLRIGAWGTTGTGDTFNGRIYSAELRTGLDPARTARYLNGTVGSVTTPNPGPLPAQHTFIVKMRPTRSTDSPNVIAGQFETEGQMSWIEQWYEGPNYHAFYYSLSPTGSSGGTVQRPISNPTDLLNTDAMMAISVTLDSAGRNRQSLQRSLDNGVTWQPVATNVDTGAAVAPFNSNTVMRIGARTGAVSPFNGRIYSVELKTGLDPAMTARYLTPTIGTVTTPDPGPLPAQCTFIFRVSRANGSNGTIVSQYVSAAGTASFILRRDVPNGVVWLTYSPNGSSSDATSVHAQSPPFPVPSQFTELIAVAADQTTGTMRSWSSNDNGATWTVYAPRSFAPFTLFDASGVFRIGAHNTNLAVFTDQIYNVELRTGLDPAAGSVVWRFDANEAPTDATTTTWTDPRGRAWTVTNPQAISGRTLWRFDANEAPTDAATTTWADPRGRQWTVTNAQAISGRTLWRFDANDYPGTGTSYVDPRGRTWTLATAGAIAGP